MCVVRFTVDSKSLQLLLQLRTAAGRKKVGLLSVHALTASSRAKISNLIECSRASLRQLHPGGVNLEII